MQKDAALVAHAALQAGPRLSTARHGGHNQPCQDAAGRLGAALHLPTAEGRAGMLQAALGVRGGCEDRCETRAHLTLQREPTSEDTDPPAPPARTPPSTENQWGTVREAARSMLHENSLEEQRKKY